MKILKNLAKPCFCGVPACGQEYQLYIEKDNEKIGINFDGGLWEGMLSDYISIIFDKKQQDQLPVFLKEFNSMTGWNDFNNPQPIVLNTNELGEALEAIHTEVLSEWAQNEFTTYYKTFMDFINTYAKNYTLYLVTW